MTAVIDPDWMAQEPDGRPLTISDLQVAFGGNKVIEDVDLAFSNGFNGLIGPNGAGKTTLFNVISGYVQPTRGSVSLHGRDLTKLSQTDRSKVGIGRTFQSPKLILDATVMENVLLGRHHLFRWGHLAELFFWPPQLREETEARHICMAMLERFELASQAHEKAGNLSLGAQKLVEMCRALVSQPQVVLLDEPAAGLGADDVSVLLRGLRELASEQQLCLVIIEHDLELVTNLCTEISVLHFGKIISKGPPEVVTNDSVVVEAYLGDSYRQADAEATGEM